MVTRLYFAEEVNAGQEDCVWFIPPEGKIYLYKFLAEAPISQSAVVKVIWKFNAAGEKLVWSTKQSARFHSVLDERLFIATQGSGETFKVALCFENADNKSFYISGLCDIEHSEV